jgi:putative ABC transport system permease protein
VVVQRKGFSDSMDVAPLSPAIQVTPELLAKIEAVPGVRAAAPRLTSPALVAVGEESSFSLMVGVDPEREGRAAPKRKELVLSGAWLDGSSTLLGAELTRGLKGSVGAVVTVLGNDKDGVMNAVEGKLAGTIGASTQGEKKLLLLPIEKARELLRMEGLATEVIVGVNNLDDVDKIAPAVAAALGPDFTVRTWKQVAPFANDVVQTQDAALGVIVTVFLLVILVGLTNALLATVLERTREIGTMIALGAKRRTVVVLFVIEASLIGFIGALAGAALGTLIVLVLGRVGVQLDMPGASVAEVLRPYMRPSFVVRLVALGTIGAIIAALYPAWRASRLDPVRALASS